MQTLGFGGEAGEIPSLCSPLHMPTLMDLYSALEHNPRNRRRVSTYRECSKYIRAMGRGACRVHRAPSSGRGTSRVGAEEEEETSLTGFALCCSRDPFPPFPYINPRSFPSPTFSLSASRLANRQHLPPKKKHHHPSCSPYPSMQWQNPPPPPPPRYP